MIRTPRNSAVLLLLAICAILISNAPSFGTTFEVVMGSDDLFHPADLTVAPDDSVYWVNQGADDHTSTSGSTCVENGLWDSGNVAPGQTFGLRFPDAGLFEYFCIPHCLMGMVGSITVEPIPTDQHTWGEIKALYR